MKRNAQTFFLEYSVIMAIIVVGIIFAVTQIFGTATAEAASPEPQKFKVAYTVTYNAVTLVEAADIEKRIKGNHQKACTVKVEMKGSVDTVLTSDESFILLDDSVTTTLNHNSEETETYTIRLEDTNDDGCVELEARIIE